MCGCELLSRNTLSSLFNDNDTNRIHSADWDHASHHIHTNVDVGESESDPTSTQPKTGSKQGRLLWQARPPPLAGVGSTA